MVIIEGIEGRQAEEGQERGYLRQGGEGGWPRYLLSHCRSSIQTVPLFQDNVLPEQKKTDQKSVDKTILAAIAKHPEKKYVNAYLGSRFSLAKNQYPHNMVF